MALLRQKVQEKQVEQNCRTWTREPTSAWLLSASVLSLCSRYHHQPEIAPWRHGSLFLSSIFHTGMQVNKFILVFLSQNTSRVFILLQTSYPKAYDQAYIQYTSTLKHLTQVNKHMLRIVSIKGYRPEQRFPSCAISSTMDIYISFTCPSVTNKKEKNTINRN